MKINHTQLWIYICLIIVLVAAAVGLSNATNKTDIIVYAVLTVVWALLLCGEIVANLRKAWIKEDREIGD
jgi:heme A synthase